MCPLPFIFWNSNPQRDGIRRWGLREVISHEDRALVNGISTCIRRQTMCFLFLCSLLCEDTRRRWSSVNQEAELHQRVGLPPHWSLDFPVCRTERNNYALFKLPGLWVFALQQPELWHHPRGEAQFPGCLPSRGAHLQASTQVRRWQNITHACEANCFLGAWTSSMLLCRQGEQEEIFPCRWIIFIVQRYDYKACCRFWSTDFYGFVWR